VQPTGPGATTSMADIIQSYLFRAQTTFNAAATDNAPNVLECPAGDRTVPVGTNPPYKGYGFTTERLANAQNFPVPRYARMDRIASPARTIFVLDAERINAGYQQGDGTGFIPNTVLPALRPRHDSRVNTGYADGAVRSLSEAEFLATFEPAIFRKVWEGR
jgi:prepilin-type processing-associated H-X9-DG protein